MGKLRPELVPPGAGNDLRDIAREPMTRALGNSALR